MARANATLRRRQLAARLRELRKEAGYSIDEVAKRLLCSSAKISRIETAQRAASLRDVRDLCLIYGVTDPAQVDALMTMAREARQPGWWQQYTDLNLVPYIGLEAVASSITEFTLSFIPSLLQTEEYADAIIRGVLPQINPETLQERVEARMKRRTLLTQDEPPQYLALIDESALHRQVGGPAVMRRQLQHIVEMAQLPNVTVQVIPLRVGAHMGLDNSFNYLVIPDPEISDLVYFETRAGNFYLEKPGELKIYREILDSLQSVAETPKASVARIAEVGAAYTT